MAEAVAGFYVAETAVEGAVVGGIAIAKSTVPLKVRFHKLPSPNSTLQRSSHSLTVVKGKAYVFGGDVEEADSNVYIITLPSDLVLKDIDYQVIEPRFAPERPLAPYSDDELPVEDPVSPAGVPMTRAGHTATTIDSTIYILGGRAPQDPQHASSEPNTSSRPLDEAGTVHAFSTTTNMWTTLAPHQSRCSSGVPCPRIYASSASTSHPQAGTAQEATVESHGTVFLHGGYDAEGQLLRDVWTFDVSSRVWSRWPDIPNPTADETAGEGSICCVESRLWRCGDGFGKVSYLEIVRDDVDDGSGRGEIGVSPKSGEWITASSGGSKNLKGMESGDEKKAAQSAMEKTEAVPVPREGAGLIPVTTGAGREYLLHFMGQDGTNSSARDVWSFQIKSDAKSAAGLKDSIRSMIGKESGENQWARCEVVESTKDEGVLEVPAGLSRFACDGWTDMGGAAVVLWGGRNSEGRVTGDGWVMIAE